MTKNLPVSKNYCGYILPVFLLIVLTIKVSAQPVNSYYVSLSGNDNNNGSKSKPFKTIEKINTLKLEPNTFIYFRGGMVFTGTLILKTGTNVLSNKPVVITSYGKGIATINGNLKEAVIINGTHFSIKNIKVNGAGRKEGNTTNGIYVTGSSFITIENVVAEGFQKSGIEINYSHNVLVKKVTAKNNGFSGISASGTKSSSKNIIISGCTADNNAGDPTNLTNHSGNGIVVGGCDSALIDHCTATSNGWDMPRIGNGPVGIWGYESDHLIIQYCISYRNKTHTGASDGGGFDLDGGVTNSIIQYCLSYENEGSGYGLYQYIGAGTWSNNTVRYCISVNDGQVTKDAASFLIWNETADSSKFGSCNVYNNTVYNSASPAIRFDNNSANSQFVFANNIFVGTNEIVSGPPSGDTYIGNIWWHTAGNNITFRGHHNPAEWFTSSRRFANATGIVMDPLLTGPLTTGITDASKLYLLYGFKLRPGSPIKNKGTDLRQLFGIVVPVSDFFGNLVGKSSTVPGVHELR